MGVNVAIELFLVYDPSLQFSKEYAFAHKKASLFRTSPTPKQIKIPPQGRLF
jgi:hypothetical protein